MTKMRSIGREGGVADRLLADVDLGNGWCCFCRFVINENQLILMELRLYPNTPHPDPGSGWFPGQWSELSDALTDQHARGLTTKVIRGIPLRWIMQEMYQAVQAADWHGLPDVYRTRLKRLPARPANPGRAGRDDRYYAVWAGRYVEALGRSNKPNEALARKHRKSPSAIRDLIHEARRRKLLSPGTPGKAGGFLTNNAIALLKEGD